MMKGPYLLGSYVVGMIMYPSGSPSSWSYSATSFQGTNFCEALLMRLSLEGFWLAGYT